MRSADFKLTHVTQIENSRRIADRKMLLDDPAVTDRHLETAENRHPCAEFLVKVEQNGALGSLHQRQNPNRPFCAERDSPARSANKPPASVHSALLAAIRCYNRLVPDGSDHHGWPGAERASDAGVARQRRRTQEPVRMH